MGTITLNVPIDQSPVPAAIDAFYDFLKTSIPPGPNDHIALLGTLVEFDITDKSLLYNDFVVRAFADRSVRVSPVPGHAAGDFADRYSTQFAGMLKQIIEGLDAELSPAQQAQIDRHEATIKALSDDRDGWLEKIDDQWDKKMKRLGIDPSKIDTDEHTRRRYIDERVIFLTEKRYAQKLWGLAGYNTKIRDKEISIGSIRRQGFPDDDYAQIYDMYTAIVDELVLRPRRPDLELIYNWDAYSIQDPKNFAMPAVFDIAPGLQSIVDPRTIRNGKGEAGYSVKTTTTVTHAHDREWNASASGSYMFFISGSFSANNTSHFRSTINKVREVAIHFEHLGELQVMRDRWFASTVFKDNKRVIKFLKKRPSLAEKLALLTTGVIVGRGLKITLKFTDSSDVQEWGSSSTSGGLGVNIYGVQLGGSGGSSSSYNDHVIDTATQTVTFKDDPYVFRLVGLRVTAVNPDVKFEDVASNSRPIWEVPDLMEAAQKSFMDGKIPDKGALLDELKKRRRKDAEPN